MSESQSIQSFADSLEEVDPDLVINIEKITDSIFKVKYDDKSCALKIFKVTKSVKKNFDEYKELFEKIIKQVMNMTALHHIAIVELKHWNIYSGFNKEWLEKNAQIDVDDLADDHENDDSIQNKSSSYDDDYYTDEHFFHPFILMPFYRNSLFEIIENKEIDEWTPMQFILFVYGCLRAFRHMNSFNFISDEIDCKKILFQKNGEFLYPKINDFQYHEDAKIPNQLNSFGNLLSELKEKINSIKQIDPFQQFISKLKSGNDQVENFYNASLIFEYIIIQLLPKQLDIQAFRDYKQKIDDFEGNNFSTHKSISSSILLDENLKDCQGNIFKVTRKTISLAMEANNQAAFRTSLHYYHGGVLPKDLVSCLQFLKFTCIQSSDQVSKSFMASLEAIRDRKLPGAESDDDCDEISLYYKGAFRELDALILKSQEKESAISDEDIIYQSMASSTLTSSNVSLKAEGDSFESEIKKAIDYYTKSLKVKKTPIVMGRLGAILTNYVNDSEDAPGPKLLKLASDGNDMYGMINYGLYLINSKKDNKAAIDIFESLYKRNYIDAAYTLGNLYLAENDLRKAKDYFIKAHEIFGCKEASKYIDEIKI